MKILVTGGAGFIGSNIVDKYVQLGHEVVIIDNLSTGRKENINPQAKFYQADICDTQKMTEIFQKEKPEVLNHHAAQMDVRKSVADPVYDAQNNLIGLLNLMERGRKNGLKQVIFASSGGAIYGDADILPTPESYLPRPASPYGIAKLASEYYLDFYKQVYSINYIALRYGNVYGPRQNPHGEAGVIAIFTSKLLKNIQPIINGDGKQKRDFVYVQDVVKANTLALNHDASIAVNIATGVGTDINTIYDILVRLTETSFSRIHGDPKPGEQKVSILDNKTAKDKLNWAPQTTLEAGLTQTVNYFKHGK